MEKFEELEPSHLSRLAQGGLLALGERHTCQEEERGGEQGTTRAVCRESQRQMSKTAQRHIGKIVPELRGAETQAMFQWEIKMCL